MAQSINFDRDEEGDQIPLEEVEKAEELIEKSKKKDFFLDLAERRKEHWARLMTTAKDNLFEYIEQQKKIFSERAKQRSILQDKILDEWQRKDNIREAALRKEHEKQKQRNEKIKKYQQDIARVASEVLSQGKTLAALKPNAKIPIVGNAKKVRATKIREQNIKDKKAKLSPKNTKKKS
jgi:hypothetical protein